MFSLSDTLKTVFKKRKRVGRGEGSNRGKNSGKGHKGQIKRAGKSPVTFEGGRKSLVRRTPKLRGFKQIQQSKNKRQQAEVTLNAISNYYVKGEEVTLENLIERGVVGPKIKFARIIKKGELVEGVKLVENDNIYLTKGVKDLIK